MESQSSPAPPPPCPQRRLHLDAISTSLRAVQADFDAINAQLDTPRDPLTDDVVVRLLLGYRYIDRLLATAIDPFALGQAHHLLELNALVLCGEDRQVRYEYRRQLAATEAHFYAKRDGSVETLIEWLQLHDDRSVWRRAAGAYVQILSQPQLFLEGNHRTGALIMSYLLARAGEPVFVLSPANAKAYFDPSTLAKNTRKHSLKMLIERPKLVKRFAALLQTEAATPQAAALAPRRVADGH